MSNSFYYEDGQGKILDEQGNDAVDWEEEYRAFQSRFPAEDTEELDVKMEELSKELSQAETSGKKYNVYSDNQKSVFYYFNRIKLWKVAPSGRKANIEPRTAQIWAKRLREDPSWNIYEKQTNKVNRKPSQLQQEHRQHLLEFFDNYPQATRHDAVESLTEALEGFSLKETAVDNFILHECNLTMKRVTLQPLSRNSPENLEERYQWTSEWAVNSDMNYLANCVFVDETGFNINIRSPFARSMRGPPAIVETPTTRAITHTVLGAITASNVIALEIREPLKPKKIKIAGGQKRKAPTGKKMPKGTVTGHYMRFIAKTLDEMDKFPEIKGFYIVMDNAPIHTSQDITTMIEARGYKGIYLPPYSPELNPIENFWSTVKGAVKRKLLKQAEVLAEKLFTTLQTTLSTIAI